MSRAFLIMLLLALAPACKQGEGERCQIDEDCEGGLICSDSQHICVTTGGTVPDGMPIIDARPDGPTPDGGPDGAPGDAMTDGLAFDLIPDVL